MNTAYSYTRFSTKEQAAGNSIERQLNAAKAYCKLHQLSLSDKRFSDMGISAFHDKVRPEFTDMLVAVQEGVIKKGDVIILESLDRLSRKGIEHTQATINNILSYGVEIACLQENLTLKSDSPNKLIDVIRVALASDLAYQESVKKSIRVKAAKQAQKDMARNGIAINKRLPYWLKRDGEQYLFNDNVGAIKLIIKLRQQGYGYHKIAMMLNQSEYKPRKSAHWSDTTVRDFLKHKALYGAYGMGSEVDGKFTETEVVENYYPAVISFTEWLTLQPESGGASRAGGHTRHNHLFGLVKCECGSGMSKKVSKRKLASGITKEYNQWVCVSSQSGGCDRKKPILDLDIHVIKGVKRLKVSNPVNVSGEYDKLIKDKADVSQRINVLTTLLSDPSSAIDSIIQGIETCKSNLRSIEHKLSKLVSTDESDIETLYESRNNPALFNLKLRELVTKILVVQKGANTWWVRLYQRNGHLISMTVFRESQRRPWNYLISNTEEIVNI